MVCLLQDVIKQLQLNVRDARAFIDQLNDAGEQSHPNLPVLSIDVTCRTAS
jgi:hypothetical protein